MSAKRYKEGYWIFMYYPKTDFLFLLFKGTKKGYWPYGTTVQEAAFECLTDHGIKEFKTKDWDSFYIDTAVTKDWKEAEAIAAKHFNTRDWVNNPSPL